MKTLIIVILVFYTNLYSQNPTWNEIILTDIPLNDEQDERIALFANHDGIHVLKVIESGTSQHVKYYRLNTAGVIEIEKDFPKEYGDFPNIVGDENIIYALYQKDNSIRVQKSTDGGSNWLFSTERIFENTPFISCNAVDAVYNNVKGLNIVWSEKVGIEYESYFDRFDGEDWIDFAPLTDEATLPNGGFPTIATSFVNGEHKAHVSINTGNGDEVSINSGNVYSRDFDYANNWSNPVDILTTGDSRIDRIIATEDGFLHAFHFRRIFPYTFFKYRKKLVTSSLWEDEKEIVNVTTGITYAANIHKIPVTQTFGDANGNKVHAFFVGTGNPGHGVYYTWKYSTANDWPFVYESVSDGGVSQRETEVTKASNDLFAMWGVGGGEPFYYIRQYDDAPLAPKNLTISRSPYNHPYLEWDENMEPDLAFYNVQRWDQYGGGWQTIAQTTNTEYEDQTLTYCTAPPGAKCPDERTFYFRVTAVDLNSHESDPSNTVSARLVGGSPDKIGVNNPDVESSLDYALGQNYPNPFNPSTKISYSLASDAFVTLRVYDILGNEVTELVNSGQTAGVHVINFDASNLSSGIYIYRVTAMNGERILFSESKRMVLIK